jgi:ubiquinone/menaquinone biosynthesis C-methylase UbiE
MIRVLLSQLHSFRYVFHIFIGIKLSYYIPGGTIMDKTRLIRTFDRQAKQYEKKRLQGSEKVWRRKLLQEVEGRVLELAVGAGANIPFYPQHVDITAVDFSQQMLNRAKQAGDEYELNIDFILSDIETIEFDDESFDTIISTLSLCGYEDPSRLLNQLNKWCKNSGQILLLEHGISANPVLSSIQKMIDPLAYKIAGCHQTRNILDLMEKSDLTVTKTESHWLGIVHLIWAKPTFP